MDLQSQTEQVLRDFSSWVLNISKDGDSTASLGNLSSDCTHGEWILKKKKRSSLYVMAVSRVWVSPASHHSAVHFGKEWLHLLHILNSNGFSFSYKSYLLHLDKSRIGS